MGAKKVAYEGVGIAACAALNAQGHVDLLALLPSEVVGVPHEA